MSHAAVAGNSFVASLFAMLVPARLLHVGVGAGAGAMHAWRAWPVETAWLIDANPASLAWLEPLAAEHPQWHVSIATLAASAGATTFYHASNPAESGLIAPSALSTLWPNLRQTGSEQHQATTLDALVGGRAAGAGSDWLLVDCLASLEILRGASETLQQCSVVWLRTLLAPLPDGENGVRASSLAQLQSLLEPLGFRCAHLGECHHPALVEAIFVRNWNGRMLISGTSPELDQAVVTDEKKQLLEQFSEQIPLQAHISRLRQENERLQQAQSTLNQQLAAWAQEQAASITRAATQDQQSVQLQQQVASLEQQKGAALARAEALEQELAQVRLVAAQAQDRDALAAHVAALEQAQQQMLLERKEQAGLLDERQRRILQMQQALLEQNQAALQQRQLADEAAAQYRAGLAGLKQTLQQETTLLQDSLARLAQQNAAQVDLLEQEKNALMQQLSVAKQAISTLTDERNEHAWQAAQRQNHVERIERQAADQMQRAQQAEARLASQQQAADEQHQQAQQALSDGRTALEALRASHGVLADSEAGLQARVALLAQQRDEQAHLAQERQNQIAQLTGATADQLTQLQQTESQLAGLLHAQQEQARELAACEEKIHLLAEVQAALREQQRQNQLHEAHAAESDARLRQQQAEITLLTQRQLQANEELVRAEAQIDLISNVLLREQPL